MNSKYGETMKKHEIQRGVWLTAKEIMKKEQLPSKTKYNAYASDRTVKALVKSGKLEGQIVEKDSVEWTLVHSDKLIEYIQKYFPDYKIPIKK